MANRNRILKRIILIFAGVLLLSPAPSYGGEVYMLEPEQRAIAYGIQVGEMLADLIIVEGMALEATGMNSRAKNMAAWKHDTYDDDHRTALSGRIYVENLTSKAYAEKYGYSGGANMPGYRTISAGGAVHAELYEARAAAWKGRIEDILAGNKYAMDDIILRQDGIKSILGDARKVVGYTRRADEAAYLGVLLDDEISKLNTDVGRRLALESEIALNEQLERSDAVAAYELAVGTWKPQGSGAGY